VLMLLVGPVFASLRSIDAAATELAAACAYLDGRNIPPDLLVTQRAHLPEPLAKELADPARASALFKRVAESALIGQGVDRVTMHPVLQHVVQTLQRPADREAWLKRMVGLVLDSFPPEPEYGGYVDGCARLLGTGLCVSETCVRFDAELRQAGVLLNRTGQYLHGFGDDEGARKCLEYAARISAKLDGESSPLLALRLNNLGAAELGAGAAHRALDLFVQALNIVKPVEQSNGELMCEILRNIANGCLEAGDLTAARKWLKEALARHVHHHGRNHVYVAECLNLLGIVYKKSGEDEKALKSFDRAVATGRMARSCDPAHLASYHAHWGKALRNAGELEKAESAFREALRLYQEQFGAEHDQTAAVLLQLARLRRRRKDYEDAINRFEQAFNIMSRIGPATALPGIAQQLGRAHSLDDNTAAAAEWLGRAVVLHDKHGGYELEDSIRLLAEAGEAMLEVERLDEAAAFYDRAKKLDEADENPDLRRSARIDEGLGQLRERAQDYPGALECYMRARSKFVRALGDNDARSALQSVHVARCLHQLGRGIEAVANVVHAERILSERLGSGHRETRRARELLEQFRD
jgi:tetratricopeptide (TPR) repeat protein